MKSSQTWIGATLLALATLTVGGAERPNVLIILSDDQGWGDLSVHGNRNLSTPRLDSLAREGVVLDRFFVQPVCSPTRAELLTGRYHPRGGVRGVSLGQERLDPNERTLAEAFRAAGYATACIGKWHNGSQWPYHPNARGFEEFYGFTEGHWGEYFDPPLEHNGQPVRGRGYIADHLTDRAIQFIEEHRQRPWLCYLAYNTPHSPFCVPNSFWCRFEQREIVQRGAMGEREDLAVTRAVLAMCENLDWNVGRVLDALDRLGLRDSTLVVFFSDNGPNSVRWNGEMKGRKGDTDEGGVRSPCFLRWPGRLPAGRVVTQICAAVDLLPTLLSLAGVPKVGDAPLDGCDLSPLLLGTATAWPDRRLFQHWNGRVSVRTERYRLDHTGKLFDMWADPSQTRDLAAELPGVAAELQEAVARWRTEVGLPTEASVQGAGGAVDPRPFPVGYPAFPRTWLPARDGTPHGHIRRSAPAPNCSYFTNWDCTEDSITWDVEIVTPGRYEVELWYTCADSDEGSVVELTLGSATLVGVVRPAWNPPLITNQDVVPRKGESYMKEFRPLRLGTIQLPAGRGRLTLRAREVRGQHVMDLRALVLTLRSEQRHP